MLNLLCCNSNDVSLLYVLNWILVLFAAFVSLGYFFKPRLHYCAFIHNDKWRVKVINKNWLLKIKEIQCEISVSEQQNFEIIKTLDLKKNSTLILSQYSISNSFYNFRTESTIHEIQNNHRQSLGIQGNLRDYKFLNVRLLAPNFLGVKKHYSRIYRIDEIRTVGDNNYTPKPISQCQNYKQQKASLN